MGINSKNILEDINNKIRNREIFKLNRAFLVRSLVIASTKVQYMLFINSQNMNMVDQIDVILNTFQRLVVIDDGAQIDVHPQVLTARVFAELKGLLGGVNKVGVINGRIWL